MQGNTQGMPVGANVPEQPGMLGALAAGAGGMAQRGQPTPEQMQMAQGNQQNPMQRFMMQIQDPAQREALAQQLSGVMPPPPEQFLQQFTTPPRIMPAAGQPIEPQRGSDFVQSLLDSGGSMQETLGRLMRPRGEM